MTKDFKYSAFISYSHADSKVVAWLHRALEGYRLPRKLVGVPGEAGPIPRKLKPFFRDRDELPASTDLTAKIKKALKNSEFLIVVCSPEAAGSKWVNQEIREFAKLRSAANILCLIVGGHPYASRFKGREKTECFPPAILDLAKKKGFEPVAADARPEGDGRRLAKLKLVSGILGIGLDRLVQRDAHRRQIRTAIGFASAAALIVVLSVLLFLAIEARKDAEEARFKAEEKRAQAEEMVDFMLGDLKTKLEPIGNLQLMDDIAMQALGYYASIDVDELDPKSLARRSEVLQMVGEIEHQRGNLDLARNIFEQAYLTTEELLKQAPDDPKRIYDHSQSIFWLAYTDLKRSDLADAEKGFLEYADFSERLAGIDPSNIDWQAEVGYAHSNLGTVYFYQGRFAEAEAEFLKELNVFNNLNETAKKAGTYDFDFAQTYAWLSDADMNLGKLKIAMGYRDKEREIYEKLLTVSPQDNQIKGALIVTNLRLGQLNAFSGKVKAAKVFFGKAAAIADDLIAFDPENTWPVENLAILAIEELEIMSPELSAKQRAELLAKTVSLTNNLTARDADNAVWKGLYFRGLSVDAENRLEHGQIAQAADAAKTANDGLQALWGDSADNFRLLGALGFSALALAETTRKSGDEGTGLAALEAFVKAAEPHGDRLSLRAKDYLGRALFLLGSKEKAKQIRDFLNKIGYVSPDFRLFWENARVVDGPGKISN